MDTGATSHLASSPGKLFYVNNKHHIESVFISNGHSIPVTHIGYSIVYSPHHPLHLHNILVTNNIIKRQIFVRRFTTNNLVSIEFDPYGFTGKDSVTLQVLLRCHSSGDLYPAPPSFQPPITLLSDITSLWHKHLGHPSANVLNNLISNHFLPCNKTSSSFDFQAF